MMKILFILAILYVSLRSQSVVVLNQSNLKETVLDPTKNVVVLFTWEGCSPCAYMKKVYQQVADTLKPIYGDDFIFAQYVYSDSKPDWLEINEFPTTKLWAKNNKENVKDFEGKMNQKDIIAFVTQFESVQKTEL